MTRCSPSLLAINWEPELRGILIVIIAVVTLCGSVYLILATNLGARLGFLVTLTGLAGWMALMGLIWMIYGIGLKGPEPSWDAVPGRTVLQDPSALYQAGVLAERPQIPDDVSYSRSAEIVAEQFVNEGWTLVPEEEPGFGQASASAGTFIEETGAFAAGEYRAVNVFDIGGDRWPKINESLDFLAFRHDPHYAVVEIAALEPTRAEPGRAAVAGRHRRDPPAPVRLHDPQPRRPAAAGHRAVHRCHADLPRAVLVAAPPRAHPHHQPQRGPGEDVAR